MDLDPLSKEPVIKLTDFGTARYSHGAAKFHEAKTDAYCSPESFGDDLVDMFLVDIYEYVQCPHYMLVSNLPLRKLWDSVVGAFGRGTCRNRMESMGREDESEQ